MPPDQAPDPTAAPDLPRLADALRRRTAALHRRAERSGLVRAIIAGQATRTGYAVYLRNLLPAYNALEQALERRRGRPGAGALYRRELLRAPALQRDLAQLAGPDWERSLPLLPQGVSYGRRVAAAAAGDGSLLLAHAYTRYLGDLGGGPLLRRRLADEVHLEPACLTFYDFPEIVNLGAYARAYRQTMDAAAAACADLGAVVEEAAVAFQLNIDLSEAVGIFANRKPEFGDVAVGDGRYEVSRAASPPAGASGT